MELAPVPAPAGLAAEIFVARPGDTWTKLRQTGGTSMRLLPGSFAVLVTTLVGLPPAVADSIDVDVPLTGVALEGEKSKEPGIVLCMHVKSGRELVARLSAGADAAFGAREDSGSGVTLLEPKPGKASSEIALGVLGNYLMVSRYAADLTRGGPYAARTMPKQAAPKAPIDVALKKSVLAGPVAALLRDFWKAKKTDLEQLDAQNRQRHGGRTPDFGDPAAALRGFDSAIEGFAKVLESSEGGHVTLEPLETRLDLRIELAAEKQGAAAEMVRGMVVGDAAPLLAMPKSAPVAVLTRSSAAEREARAKSLADGLGDLFGDRLQKTDREKVDKALGQLASGRGDVEAYAVVLDPNHGGLVYRAPTTDGKAFDAGVKGLVRLLEIKAFADPIRQFVGDVSVKLSTAEAPGIPGSAQRAVLTVKPSAMRAAKDNAGKLTAQPQTLEALWWMKDGRALGAISTDAVPVLGALLGTEADAKATHASDARSKAALSRVTDASFVVFLQPIRLNWGRGASMDPDSPLVASLGRTGNSAYLRVDIDQVALDSMLKVLVLGGK